MFEFLRRIPGMLNRKKDAPPAAPSRAAAADNVEDAGLSENAAGAAKKPRRPKSPSQRRSGPKPKGGGSRPKRKK